MNRKPSDQHPVAAGGPAHPAGEAGRPASPVRHAGGRQRSPVLPRVRGERHLGRPGDRPASRGADETGPESDPQRRGIDSQSAKTASGGAEVGTGGAKNVRGRKRHLATDTLGLLLTVVVTAANCDDGETAPRVLAGLDADRFPRPAVVWADEKYRNNNLDAWLAGQTRLRVEVTNKPEDQMGFKSLKKRWVVEQAFAGLIKSWRLVRDDDWLPTTGAAMVKVSGIHRMARRARPPRGKRKFRFRRKTAA